MMGDIKKIRPAIIANNMSVRIVILFVIISLCHPFIANDVPIVIKDQNGISFPIIKKIFGNGLYIENESEWSIMPPIPYSANTVDLNNSNYKSPFSTQKVNGPFYRHWLGTDKLGRDTLAGLLYGTWIALLVGTLAALSAVTIGVSLGLLAGYYGNMGIQFNAAQFALLILGLVWLIYLLTNGLFFGSNYDMLLELGVILFSGLCLYVLIKYLGRISMNKYSLPFDQIVLRILELFKSVPNLFLILALLAVIKYPSIFSIVWIIAFVSWPISCRYTRAEVLAAKEEDYIKSAKSLGIPSKTIVLKHILRM